nr:immunoglobulin light chain junction region [Macaca mulatta]
CHQYNNWVTF